MIKACDNSIVEKCGLDDTGDASKISIRARAYSNRYLSSEQLSILLRVTQANPAPIKRMMNKAISFTLLGSSDSMLT